MILMRDIVFGSPAHDLADAWCLPSKVLKGNACQELIDCVTTAARALNSDCPNPFVQIVEIAVDDDTAASYMMNLRLQNDDKEIWAFWFDSKLEAKVAAWSLAVPAIEKVIKGPKSVKTASSKLSAAEKALNLQFKIRSKHFAALLKAIDAEFDQAAALLQSQLKACLI